MGIDLSFKKPIVQYLFLLSENQNYLSDIKKVRDKFRREIITLAKAKRLTSLIQQEIGSEELKSAIRKIADNSPLGITPEWFLVNAFTVFLLAGYDKYYVLKQLDTDAIKTLIGPPLISFKVDRQETIIELAMSNYHTKLDAIKFLNKSWPSIEVERKKVNSKLKYRRPQPIKDFGRDWKIYCDKSKGKSYEKLRAEYEFIDPNSIKMIVRRLRRKINSLYLAR